MPLYTDTYNNLQFFHSLGVHSIAHTHGHKVFFQHTQPTKPLSQYVSVCSFLMPEVVNLASTLEQFLRNTISLAVLQFYNHHEIYQTIMIPVVI